MARVTHCLLGNITCFLVVSRFFSESTFSKNSFRNTTRVSNSLDPDEARHFVEPKPGSKLFAQVMSRRHQQAKITLNQLDIYFGGDMHVVLLNIKTRSTIIQNRVYQSFYFKIWDL